MTSITNMNKKTYIDHTITNMNQGTYNDNREKLIEQLLDDHDTQQIDRVQSWHSTNSNVALTSLLNQ